MSYPRVHPVACSLDEIDNIPKDIDEAWEYLLKVSNIKLALKYGVYKTLYPENIDEITKLETEYNKAKENSQAQQMIVCKLVKIHIYGKVLKKTIGSKNVSQKCKYCGSIVYNEEDHDDEWCDHVRNRRLGF